MRTRLFLRSTILMDLMKTWFTFILKVGYEPNHINLD
eukprot:XP_001704885.1 Hypothetical protein GL50803_3280 [Giardia lamblia ATCC 50803]